MIFDIDEFNEMERELFDDEYKINKIFNDFMKDTDSKFMSNYGTWCDDEDDIPF